MFIDLSPLRSVGLFIVQYVIFGAIVTLGRIQHSEQPFILVVFFGKNLHLHLHKWIIEGAICYIELACVVPLSGGETVYIKVLIFISEPICVRKDLMSLYPIVSVMVFKRL